MGRAVHPLGRRTVVEVRHRADVGSDSDPQAGARVRVSEADAAAILEARGVDTIIAIDAVSSPWRLLLRAPPRLSLLR